MARPALSASRAAAIITFLAGHPRRLFTMAEIIRGTGINVGSCFAVPSSLVESGFLLRDDVQKAYGLGPAMVASGSAAFESHPVAAHAQQVARDLAYELDVAVLLTTKLGDNQLVLSSAEARGGRKFEARLGQRIALTPPLGAHLVAWASAAEINRWIEKADPDPALADIWRESLEQIRNRGYHISLRDPLKASASEMMARMVETAPDVGTTPEKIALVNQLGWDFLVLESFDMDKLYNVSTIAAPIFFERTRPPLSLTIGVFGRQLTGAQIDSFIQRLLDTCVRIMEHGRPH